ncbi:MAG: Gfo/Idh/MocA family oxidoreductase [Fuerstiella sp.]
MNRLRIAVVGVGSLGQHHAGKLAAFEDVELVGVVDPAQEQGQRVATRLQTTWFPTVQSLPRDLDGVVIAAPTSFHLSTASFFLEAGVATFVEKPLAASVTEAQTLWRTAAHHDALLQVGHIERFNPAFDVARQRCGHPLYIRAQRVSPYTFRSTDIGVVHDLMIHDIDLALALTGEMPTSVDAFGAEGIGPHEDMAVARLKMPSGTIVDLTASRMCPTAERTMQIWGSTGCLQADLQSRKVTHWQPGQKFQANPALVHAIAAAAADPRTLKDKVFGEWIQAEEIQADSADAMSLELEEFKAAIRGEYAPQVGGHEGVNAMIVAQQVLSSLDLWSWQTGSMARPDQQEAA